MTVTLTVADLASDLDASTDPNRWVARQCHASDALLAAALGRGDLARIVEIRTGAEAVYAQSVSAGMPIEVQLTAAASVRRAERGTALAVRAGQAAGEIRRQRASHSPLPSPTEVACVANSSVLSDIYPLADGVTDDEFATAVEAAHRAGVMTRAAVIRMINTAKAAPAEGPAPAASDKSPAAAARRRELIRELADRGNTSDQIADRLGIGRRAVQKIARKGEITIPADAVHSGSRRVDSARVGRETVTTIEALASGIPLISLTDIDPAEALAWADSLTESLRILTRFAADARKQAK